MPPLSIFFEALWDVSILPFGDQNSFYAILQFKPELAYQAVAMATLGAVLACAANWFAGHLIGKRLQEKYASSKRFIDIQQGFNRYGWPLLLLTWTALGSVLPLIAGAMGYPLKRTLPLCAVAMAGFYMYQITSYV